MHLRTLLGLTLVVAAIASAAWFGVNRTADDAVTAVSSPGAAAPDQAQKTAPAPLDAAAPGAAADPVDAANEVLEAPGAVAAQSDEKGPYADGELLMNRGNVRAYRCYDCQSGIQMENPYSELSLDQLHELARYDATAAFQLAIRLERDEGEEGEEGEDEPPVSDAEVDRMAMRSFALAPAEDVAWYYAGAVEHLNLHNRSDWRGVPDDRLLRAYKWLEAGAQLGFVQDDLVVSAREEIQRRSLDAGGAVAAAKAHAASVTQMRLALSGQLLTAPDRDDGT